MGTTDTSSRLDRQLKNFLKKMKDFARNSKPNVLKNYVLG